MNNRIAPVQDSDSGPENQSPRAISSTSQSGSNSIIAGGVGIFSSGFAFGITVLSLNFDIKFNQFKNQTSFAENLGDDEKYGFALAISALTFLTSFLLARSYLKKFDRENNNQSDGTQVDAQLVFSHGNRRASFERRDSASSIAELDIGGVDPRTSFERRDSSTSSISKNSR